MKAGMGLGRIAREDLVRISRSPVRHVGVLILDGLISAAGLTLAMLLRFDGAIPPQHLRPLPTLVGILVLARVTSLFFFRVHRWSFRLSGLADGVRLAAAGTVGTLAFLTIVYAVHVQPPPRSTVVLEWLMSLAVMAAVRFSPRYAAATMLDFNRGRSNGGPHRTLIVGAGAAGEMLLRDLQRSDEHDYRVIGFVDDDASKWGLMLSGKPVLGCIDDLPRIVAEHRIGNVLLAIPRLPAHRIREILSLCSDLKVQLKILPVSFVYLNERVTSSMLEDLSPEDLLQREQVMFVESEAASTIRNRSVIVTGAAGSIGSEICRQLAQGLASRLVMVDLNENEMYLLKRRLEREFPSLELFAEVADIRDLGRMRSLFERFTPQDVFHAAAHKHVPLMESAPCEAVKNNIVGTLNVARAAHEYSAERFVYISTDKAVRPTSVMGATKRVGEKVVRHLAKRSSTRFCAVRFGNVLGSAGSVVPLFREQIANGGPVTVTHPEVRRYFMTIAEAVGLVLRAGFGGFGELCVLDMGDQIRIVDLARHMITMTGQVPDIDVRIEFIGLRPGEKLFEELLTEEEESTHRVSDKLFLARSPAPPDDLEERIAELASAAHAEDGRRVIELLARLVPSYQPGPPPVGSRDVADAAVELTM